MKHTEKCGQIWFFVNFGERLLRNKKDSLIQNINTLLSLPFSYILNAKVFLKLGINSFSPKLTKNLIDWNIQ